MKMLLPTLAGLVCLTLFAAPAAAQLKTQANDAQKFVLHLANCDYAEIQMAELAKKNAASNEVKTFAQKMVEQHDQARKDLLNQFKDLKIGVVSTMEKNDKDLYDRLSGLKGADFDREYMKAQVDRHQQSIKYLQDNAKSADANIRGWSEKQLKTLQDHLKHAQQIQKNLK